VVKSADGVKLFGSVNNSHIQEELANQGHEIDKTRISIDGRNIKRVGNYVAHIRLHRELTFDLPFVIEADPDSIIKKTKSKKAGEVVEQTEEATAQKDENLFEKKESIDDVLGILGGNKKETEEEITDSAEMENPQNETTEEGEN
jgi:hypothetical protein